MVTKACDWCKKEDKAFIGGVEPTPKSIKPQKPIEVDEEELVAAQAQ